MARPNSFGTICPTVFYSSSALKTAVPAETGELELITNITSTPEILFKNNEAKADPGRPNK
jgi:hypothetical protein